MMNKDTLPLSHSPPKSRIPVYSWGKNKTKQEKTQIEGHSTKYLSWLLQKCQGHEKPGMTERPSQTRGEEMGTVTKYSRLFWTRDEYSWKSCDI